MKKMFVFWCLIMCWLGIQKTYQLPLLQNRTIHTQIYIYTYVNIYIWVYIYILISFFASSVGLPRPIQCPWTTSFLASKMWKMSCLILVGEKWRNVAKEWMCQMLQDRPNILPIWHRTSPTRLDMSKKKVLFNPDLIFLKSGLKLAEHKPELRLFVQHRPSIGPAEPPNFPTWAKIHMGVDQNKGSWGRYNRRATANQPRSERWQSRKGFVLSNAMLYRKCNTHF